jgi:hypothetical protein
VRAFVLVTSLIASMVLTSPARATSVQVLSLEEMAERATVIVEATVVDVRVEHEGTRAATYTTLRVDDAIEGSARNELLVIFQPGAHPRETGGDVRWLMGHRAYRVGERVMFFGVRHRRAGIDVVVHLTLGYGTFDVAADDSVREVVLDVVDASSNRAPVARTFTSGAHFRAALGGLPQCRSLKARDYRSGPCGPFSARDGMQLNAENGGQAPDPQSLREQHWGLSPAAGHK